MTPRWIRTRAGQLLVVIALLTACATSDGPEAGAAAAALDAVPPTPTTVPPTAEPRPTAVATTPTPAATTSTDEPTAEPTLEPEPTSAPSATPNPCRALEEFGAGAAERWRIVNDGVMGGLSQGLAEFDGDTMRFFGTINTNGGGFTSVRFALPLGALDAATELRIHARSDGRSYELLADDALAGRDRRVSHFGGIPLSGGQWTDAVVRLDDLDARLFGTPVNDAAFRPDLAVEIGLILSDGIDGPFEIEIDRIEAC